MGMEKADNLQSALDRALSELGVNAEIVIIPDGGVVLPILTAEPQNHQPLDTGS
jgi:hypothetical protein